MSRGHGKLQSKLVAILAERNLPATAFLLAQLAFDVQVDADGTASVNDAQLCSVRRALTKLAREGLVIGDRRSWRQLWRLSSTPALNGNTFKSSRQLARELGVGASTVDRVRKKASIEGRW